MPGYLVYFDISVITESNVVIVDAPVKPRPTRAGPAEMPGTKNAASGAAMGTTRQIFQGEDGATDGI